MYLAFGAFVTLRAYLGFSTQAYSRGGRQVGDGSLADLHKYECLNAFGGGCLASSLGSWACLALQYLTPAMHIGTAARTTATMLTVASIEIPIELNGYRVVC